MAYLDIVFQNIQNGGAGRIGPANSRAFYTRFPTTVNVCQTPGVGGFVPATLAAGGFASAAWGPNITGAANQACGIFFCESSAYPYWLTNYNANWAAAMAPPVPPAPPGFPPVAVNSAVPAGPAAAVPPAPPLAPNPAPPNSILNSFTPFTNVNYLCAFLEGLPDAGPLPAALPLAPVSPNWLLKSNANCALQCLGTGDPTMYAGAAPSGSDRYGIYFQATNRTYNGGANPITGLFAHTKNTAADPGTQIAALCRRFPNEIIFGDLNLNMTQPLKLESLQAAIGATHTLLAIQRLGGGGAYYCTHRVGLAWNSCLDYALVPNAHTALVELWARRPGAAVALDTNGSDHAIMMLRIHCN